MDTGASIPEWGGRRAQEALRKVKAEGRRRRMPCCICRQRIDYDLVKPHPDACTVQHVKSRKAFPELTWDPSNWGPAHATCNFAAGVDNVTPADVSTAATSMEW